MKNKSLYIIINSILEEWMADKKLLDYEKPLSIDAGKVASVLGAVCSTGNGATDGCIDGVNPDTVFTCEATGSTADNDCNSNGTSAGSNCLSTGGTATVACVAGSTPLFCGAGAAV